MTRSFVLGAALTSLAIVLPALGLAASPPTLPAPAVELETVEEGLRVEVSIEPIPEEPIEADAPADAGRPEEGRLEEGRSARVRLRITDTATGRPMPGLYPGAWMDRIPPKALVEEGPESCRDKVESFLGGSLLAQPEVDLNVYYVLALNDDPSINVVDPLFGFGGSKLLAKVMLPGVGHDWVLSEDGRRLFVSVPEAGEVVEIDTAVWKPAARIKIRGRPARLALQEDGRYLWIADDAGQGAEAGGSGVVAFDLEKREIAGRVPTGAGPHDLVLTRGDAHLFVSNAGAGTVSVVDPGTLSVVRHVDLAVGESDVPAPGSPAPTSLDYSQAGHAVYAADPGTGRVSVIDARSLRLRASMDAGVGVSRVRFPPPRDGSARSGLGSGRGNGGRLGFLVNPREDVVHIFDASADRIVQTADVEDEPREISFSDELAYVHHAGSEIVLMIPLGEIGEAGRPVPVVDFPGGQRTYGEAGARPTPADAVVQAPGASAVLVANPADQMIYYYKEGMAAPMGSFRNYGHRPRAVRVVDRSLAEVEEGVYETAVQLGRPGSYDLAVFFDSPRLFHCFPFRVAANPELDRERRATRGAEVTYLAPAAASLPAGEPVTVRFRLADPLTGEAEPGRRDVQMLAFLVPGIWQQRQAARHVGGGEYEAVFTPTRAGIYRVHISSPSLRLPVNRSPSLGLRVEASGSASNRPAPNQPAPSQPAPNRSAPTHAAPNQPAPKG